MGILQDLSGGHVRELEQTQGSTTSFANWVQGFYRDMLPPMK